jgi:hypothetical protein
MTMRSTFFEPIASWIVGAAIVSLSGALHAEPSAPIKASLIQVKKIWAKAPHNAFTDLIRCRDRWYCAFREGETHVGSRGILRIITSTDGDSWQSVATLEDPVYDLRDANLSVTPQGQLMAVGGAQLLQGSDVKTGTFASYSVDGNKWTPPTLILPMGRWMWGVTWHQGTAWGVSYAAPDRHGVASLLSSTDGRSFNTIVENYFVVGDDPTEARIRFTQQGDAYCLQRTDGNPNLAFLGVAEPPYRDWKWSCLDRFVGGPNLLQLPTGDWIAAGRLLDGERAYTGLMYLDIEHGTAEPILHLPSGGDSSYPGLVWHNKQLWMSYYSSHEGRTSIYLARIDVTSRWDAR